MKSPAFRLVTITLSMAACHGYRAQFQRIAILLRFIWMSLSRIVAEVSNVDRLKPYGKVKCCTVGPEDVGANSN
jgi:hypothetical protein